MAIASEQQGGVPPLPDSLSSSHLVRAQGNGSKQLGLVQVVYKLNVVEFYLGQLFSKSGYLVGSEICSAVVAASQKIVLEQVLQPAECGINAEAGPPV